jgi:hypothetical protein
MNLLDARGLKAYADRYRVRLTGEDVIKRLWRIGLLRADVVETEVEVTKEGLELLGPFHGGWLYLDERPVPHFPDGLGGSFRHSCGVLDSCEPLFHPFRTFVLYHVSRVFEFGMSSTQFLSSEEGIHRITESEMEHWRRWTSSESCRERFQYWNRVAESAIVTEPAAYSKVFGVIRISGPSAEEDYEKRLQEHDAEVQIALAGIGREVLSAARQNLVHSAEMIDGNRNLHVLGRLLSAQERERFQDRFGLAMMLLTMAEMIRRPAESAFGTWLPEEDEIGFGQWFEGARKRLYGTERVADADVGSIREFLTHLGVTAGLKVRVYLEGETEAGAFGAAFGGIPSVDLVNLRGQVVERGGKGLAFVDSLRRDKDLGIFSVILLDADRQDYVRALKKAEADDIFLGYSYCASPDFEFENFTVLELTEIVQEILADGQGALMAAGEQEILEAKNAREFFDCLERHGIPVHKGELWGRALMNYAMHNPEISSSEPAQRSKRPVVEAIDFVLRAQRAGFRYSEAEFRMDPATGRPARRS